ncbi:MAG: preprotein translocase subunit YajC [Fastidiosipilaceae bacterium]|jgi:preprotein translocase subunit YajC
MFNQLSILMATAATAQESGSPGSMLSMLALPVLLIVVMYFLLIRPEKKREKKKAEKRDAMEVGDQIMTIGGIIGKIVNIRDDEVTISTSVANSLLTFRKDAISDVVKPEDALKAAQAKLNPQTAEPKKKGLFGFLKKDEDE